MTTVYVAVEGRTDAPVAKRLVQLVGLRPERASENSPSLRRTIAALRKLVADRIWT